MRRETFKLTCTRDHHTGRFLKVGPESASQACRGQAIFLRIPFHIGAGCRQFEPKAIDGRHTRLSRERRS